MPFSGSHLTAGNSTTTRRPRQIIVRRRIRAHVCSVDAASRSCPSNCNTNLDTLGNAMSQKENVATKKEEKQKCETDLGLNSRIKNDDDTNESDEYT